MIADISKTKENGYLGNSNVKKDGVDESFTAESLAEYIKCSEDAIYFIKTYCKVIHLDKGLTNFELYDFQERMIEHISDNRMSVLCLGRQQGKSVTSVAWLLWFILFQGNKQVGILANKGAIAREMLSRLTLMLESIPFFLQPGCKELNKGSIKFSNNSKIVAAATSGPSIRGLSLNCITGESSVTISVDGTVVDISIDELNDLLTTNKSIKDIMVLTQDGFKEFDGVINRGVSNEILRFEFDNGKSIRCTKNHKFLLRDGKEYLEAEELNSGDMLYPNVSIVSIDEETCDEEVFDLLNVKDTNSFYSSGVINSNCIFLDEFAFVKNAEEFYTSTFPTISSGKDSKVIITSTPNGVGNMFYRIWEAASQGTSDFKPFRTNWWDVPGRDEEWKRAMIANTSELQWQQEHECSFLGSSNTLISSSALLGLKSRPPIKTHNNVRYFAEPIQGHTYVMTVDTSKGKGQDYSTFTIIDTSVQPFNQVAVYRDNLISPLLFPDIIVRNARMYNEALILLESNGAEVVANAIYHEYEYENTFVESSVKSSGVGVTMTKRVKRIGCSNLADIVESGKLTINDVDCIAELSSFEAKGASYEASGNNHDDLVMNLVLFAWFVSTDMFQDSSTINLRELLYSDRLKEMEDDVVPFGVFHTEESDKVDTSKYDELIQAAREWNL